MNQRIPTFDLHRWLQLKVLNWKKVMRSSLVIIEIGLPIKIPFILGYIFDLITTSICIGSIAFPKWRRKAMEWNPLSFVCILYLTFFFFVLALLVLFFVLGFFKFNISVLSEFSNAATPLSSFYVHNNLKRQCLWGWPLKSTVLWNYH